MGMKSKLRDAHFEELESQPGRLKCRYCDWTHVDNVTRLAGHFNKYHADQAEPGGNLKQSSIVQWGERSFNMAEQERAEQLLAMFQVEHGLPFQTLEGEAFRCLCRQLRFDFKVPSRRTLQRRVSDIYKEMLNHVNAHLGSQPLMNLAIDGWEDGQKLESIGITAQGLQSQAPAVLITFEQLHCRETSDNLVITLKNTLDRMQGLGCKCLSIIADNAKNMSNALRELSMPNQIIPLNTPMNC